MTEEKKSDGFGISGFILGIVSLTIAIAIYFFGPFLTGSIISIIGFIFCLKQQKRHKTKKGKVGIILNLIGFVINTALFIYVLIVYIIPYILTYLQSGTTGA